MLLTIITDKVNTIFVATAHFFCVAKGTISKLSIKVHVPTFVESVSNFKQQNLLVGEDSVFKCTDNRRERNSVN